MALSLYYKVLVSYKLARRIHRVTALVTFVGAVFCLFFQIAKLAPFRNINPFGDDPYDAVGSIAIQVAFVAGALTCARALRLRETPEATLGTRLILRGNIVVLSAVMGTLIADAIAEFVRPMPSSYWGNVLTAALALMFLLAMLCIIALAVVFRGIPVTAPAANLTIADGLDDLLTLVRVPVMKARRILPPTLVQLVVSFNSDMFFTRFRQVNPRNYPWRFACALGLLVGVGLVLAQMQEGPPPSVAIGLLVAGIFISTELVATLLGFFTLGRYLGLRPSTAASRPIEI